MHNELFNNSTVTQVKEGIKLYNSQNTSNQMLKDNFVIRLKEFKKLWRAIENSQMTTPEQHYIVQGVRGSGKTTLLNRLALAVDEHPNLSQWLIPIVFKEEEYGITSLFTLLERIAEELYQHDIAEFDSLSEKIEAVDDVDPKLAINLLNTFLKKSKKKIILFIDNLVELFENFNEKETEILRELLTTNNNIRLIGGSSVSLEIFYDNKSPFYQFFNIITLKELSKKDTFSLLNKLSEYASPHEIERFQKLLKAEPEKIESIRRLTGGIPRTIVILYNILMDGPKGQSYSLLEETIDQTTPLYKHRMDDLSKQQKPIINAIALHWDAMSAKEIAEKTRLESKLVSAQLRQLEKQWIVKKIPTSTKNHLYILNERFFNIWYLVRYGRRNDRKKVIWLTRFFEIWCSADELKNRSQLFIEQLNQHSSPKAALNFANALICSDSLEENDKQAVFEATRNYLSSSKNQSMVKELLTIIPSSNSNQQRIVDLGVTFMKNHDDLSDNEFNELVTLLETQQDYLLLVTMLYLQGNESSIKKAKLFIPKIDKNEPMANFYLAGIHSQEGDNNKAIHILENPINQSHGYSLRLLGDIYAEMEKYELALKNYLAAIDLDSPNCFVPLARAYQKLNLYIDSEKYARIAVKAQEKEANTALGYTLFLQDKYDEALKYMLIAENKDINKLFIYAAIAQIYYLQEKPEIAKQYSIKSLELSPNSGITNRLLANIYIDKAQDPQQALKYSTTAYDENPIAILSTHIFCLLWNNKFETATQLMNEYIVDKLNDHDIEDILELFMFWLAKGQTNLVEKWFKEYKLQDQLKPLYYVLMSMMTDKYPNEMLRMGDELIETVNEIKLKVKELQESYW